MYLQFPVQYNVAWLPSHSLSQHDLHHVSCRSEENSGHQTSLPGHDNQESEEVLHIWSSGKNRRSHTHKRRHRWIIIQQPNNICPLNARVPLIAAGGKRAVFHLSRRATINNDVVSQSRSFALSQVLDDKNVRRRFRASNYQSTTRVKPFICTMPMRLDDGWNQIQFNLSDFTRRAYGTNYIETLRVQVCAEHEAKCLRYKADFVRQRSHIYLYYFCIQPPINMMLENGEWANSITYSSIQLGYNCLVFLHFKMKW